MLNFFLRRRKVTATRIDGMTFMVSIDNDPSLTFTVAHSEGSGSMTANNTFLKSLEPDTQREVIRAIHRTGNNSRSSGASNVALVAAIALLGLVSLASVGQLSEGQPATGQQCSFASNQFDPASLSLNTKELDEISAQSQGLTELEELHRNLKAVMDAQQATAAAAGLSTEPEQTNNTAPNRTSEYAFGY